MRIRRRSAELMLVALVMGTVVMLDSARPVSACSCAVGTDRQHFKSAQVVFTGELSAVRRPAEDIESSLAPAEFVFAVDRVYKGAATASQSVFTAQSGASCGLELRGTGPFLVFAFTGPDELIAATAEGDLNSNLCSGTRPLGTAGVVPARFGRGYPPAAAEPPTTTTAPSTSPGTGSSAAAADSTDSSDGSGWIPLGIGVAAFASVALGVWAFVTDRRRRRVLA